MSASPTKRRTIKHRKVEAARRREPAAVRLSHQRRQLANGLTLLAVAVPQVHRVVIDARIVVGSRYETPKSNGISHFLEHMLYRGTPSHPSAHALALAFERLGGTLDAATSADHGSMCISVPPESVESVIPLFAEVFQRPIFSELATERGIVKEEILESLDERGRLVDADDWIRALSFPGHGLGFPITGTLQQLETFDRARITHHHRRRYNGHSTVICVAGPIKPESCLERLAEAFAELDPGSRPRVRPPPAQRAPRFAHVRHTDSQTHVRVGFRAPGERDPDEPATELVLRILDDGLSTRLYHRVCDQRGLCYDVGAGYEAYADSGLVELAAETAHERAYDVLDELLRIVAELKLDGPTDEELALAKQRLRWQFDEMLDEPGTIAEFYALSELAARPETPRQRYERLMSVTRSDVQRVAASVFSPARLNVALVGLAKARERDRLERLVNDFA